MDKTTGTCIYKEFERERERERESKYIRKLKGILMWHFQVLDHAWIVSSTPYSSFLMVLENIPLP